MKSTYMKPKKLCYSKKQFYILFSPSKLSCYFRIIKFTLDLLKFQIKKLHIFPTECICVFTFLLQ